MSPSKSKAELARLKKNVRYMEKSGQVDTVHHQALAQAEGKQPKPPKPQPDKEISDGE